ncbi:hypothetical protein [Streptomyces hygroscopicus]|uniref:hypothetical protein n=1 Tax=Streptomyces hygroscopicus TaxID=1912 RepID=UPI0007824E3C|nr:hypothetical protein [Streptomyces hygroscopicus]
MTPLERLLAEELPTGMFGGPRSLKPESEPRTPAQPRTPGHMAAEHRRVLDEALGGWEYNRSRRHLRVVPPPDTTTADTESARAC